MMAASDSTGGCSPEPGARQVAYRFGKFLTRLWIRLGEYVDLTALVSRHLRDDVRRRAEAGVQPRRSWASPAIR